MDEQIKKRGNPNHTHITRRGFIKKSCNVMIGAAYLSLMPQAFWVDETRAAIPVSQGYLLVDTHKCQGCMTCMMACSLAHHGEVNLSLSRLQILQNSFQKYPEDLVIAQCRQCAKSACLEACETGALYVNKRNGNVRMIDTEKCIGCMACVDACPFTPKRLVWNHEKGYAQKCDLCHDTPFWSEKGGVAKKQACIKMCPIGAIAFTAELPPQEGDNGYEINLRKEDGWGIMKRPTD